MVPAQKRKFADRKPASTVTLACAFLLVNLKLASHLKRDAF